MLAQSIAWAQLLLQHSAVANDDSEKVVEIVCDSSRQASDGLHFLRHSELLFEHPLFCHILCKHFKVRRDAVFVVDAAAGTPYRDWRAVLPLPLHFQVLDLFSAG